MSDDEAKELLATILEDLGIEQAPICAAWLIQNGFVVGRRFECGTIKAVWLFDENEVKVCDRKGKLLKVIAPTTTMGTIWT